jgi:hypothetical protein
MFSYINLRDGSGQTMFIQVPAQDVLSILLGKGWINEFNSPGNGLISELCHCCKYETVISEINNLEDRPSTLTEANGKQHPWRSIRSNSWLTRDDEHPRSN